MNNECKAAISEKKTMKDSMVMLKYKVFKWNLVKYAHSYYHVILFCRHDDLDLVIIRENTEGEYSHIEHEVCISHV